MRSRVAVSTAVVAVAVVLVIAVVAAAVVLGSSPSTSTTGENSTTGTGTSSGQIAVMATDPVASGSGTREYEHYYNEDAHRSSSGGSSGGDWVKLNVAGTLRLDTLVNASQTVALANVQAGTYDSIRFYFDSVTVTYNGKNYTAQTSSGQVTASLSGNAQVGGSTTTVVLFDLRTVAINVGSSSSPQFVVTSSARAEVVPSGAVEATSLQVGSRTDLSTSAWFKTFMQDSARLQVTGAAISSSSMSVTVKDSGSETSNVTYVIVTPLSLLASVQVVMPDSLQASAVFMVGSGGTLQSSTSLLAQVTSPPSSLSVASSDSAALSYSGSMQFGTGAQGLLGVQAGQQYLITVVGTNSVASATVTAG